MKHLTFKQASQEATTYNMLLAKGFIQPDNQQPLDEAIESSFE